MWCGCSGSAFFFQFHITLDRIKTSILLAGYSVQNKHAGPCFWNIHVVMRFLDVFLSIPQHTCIFVSKYQYFWLDTLFKTNIQGPVLEIIVWQVPRHDVLLSIPHHTWMFVSKRRYCWMDYLFKTNMQGNVFNVVRLACVWDTLFWILYRTSLRMWKGNCIYIFT